MRKSAIAIAIALVGALLLPVASNAAPKAGAKCTKKGKIQVYKSYEYKCVKKSGKLVWSKGKSVVIKPALTEATTATPLPSLTPKPEVSATPTPANSSIPTPEATPSSSPTVITEANFVFQDLCEKDPFVPSDWNGMEQAINSSGRECSWPYRIVKKTHSTLEPKTKLNENVSAINLCKLRNNENKDSLVAWPSKGVDFWMKSMRHISKNSSIQIVPIFTEDAPDNGKNPADDYKPYFDFLSDWVDHASDGQGKLTIKIPTRYIQLPGKIKEFNLVHERPESVAERFRRALETHVAPKIDFSGSPTAMIVLPVGSDFSLVQQVGLGQSQIGDNVVRWSIYPPFTLTKPITGSSNFIHPAWWLHELHHMTTGFDDNDQQSVEGLSFWGLMSWSATEMLGWHKWIVDLWSDNRVFCADLANGGTYWIAPSSHQTQMKKLLVLPVSNSKVVVVESMRAGGLSFKMPTWMEGVLVYGIDNTTTKHHSGSFVIKPQGRNLLNPTLKGLSRTFLNSDAALKQGEYALYGGYKITVLESGTFGDVVRVEKA